MQNSNDNKLYDAIIASSKGKIQKSAIEKAKNGDLGDIMASLSKDDAQKLNDALSSREKTQELLSSDAAKAILKMFTGGAGNG